MRQKLAAGEYSVPGEFTSDIQLIFNNAKLYNARGSEVSESSAVLTLGGFSWLMEVTTMYGGMEFPLFPCRFIR